MLKKSASFVLASLRGSTYRSVRLASSLAAAALDGYFEHPALRSCNVTIRKVIVKFKQKLSFSAACYAVNETVDGRRRRNQGEIRMRSSSRRLARLLHLSRQQIIDE
jgi:hypothetical protein